MTMLRIFCPSRQECSARAATRCLMEGLPKSHDTAGKHDCHGAESFEFVVYRDVVTVTLLVPRTSWCHGHCTHLTPVSVLVQACIYGKQRSGRMIAIHPLATRGRGTVICVETPRTPGGTGKQGTRTAISTEKVSAGDAVPPLWAGCQRFGPAVRRHLHSVGRSTPAPSDQWLEYTCGIAVHAAIWLLL